MIEFLSNLVSTDLVTIFFLALIVVPIYYKMGLLSFGKKNGNGVPEWAKELKNHYNEETSELLKEINNGIKEINTQHKIWNEVGIPTRKCKKHE